VPLLDHFRPPLSSERRWESFHSSWATRLADALTEHWLPPNYIAEENAHFGPSIEIDVATFEREVAVPGADAGGAIATIGPKVWAPPAADGVLPAVFPDTFEIRVLSTDTGPKVVAAIELISPGNKDRPAERRAFATKCASYLYEGVSVIIVDVVTNRRANLHNEILQFMEVDADLRLPPESNLYAVAYRPIRRSEGDQIDVWRSALALGSALPTLPLGLSADLVIPVDFEPTYAEACLRKRLTGSCGKRTLAVEFAAGRILLDDAERAKLPTGTTEVDVRLLGGKLSVAADGKDVFTTDEPK
jgi:Protein of unknown function (DUF4058)